METHYEGMLKYQQMLLESYDEIIHSCNKVIHYSTTDTIEGHVGELEGLIRPKQNIP